MPLPSSKNEPPKSLGELLTDPHFIFTILSLIMSLVVFFYYLYQLLFKTDWKGGETPTKARTAAAAARADGFRKANAAGKGIDRDSAEKQKNPKSQALDAADNDARLAELEARLTERMAARAKQPSEDEKKKVKPAMEPTTTSSVADIDEALDVTMDDKKNKSNESSAALRHRRPAAKLDD